MRAWINPDKSNGEYFFWRIGPICAQCASARDYLGYEAAESKYVDVLLKCEFCDKRLYCADSLENIAVYKIQRNQNVLLNQRVPPKLMKLINKNM